MPMLLRRRARALFAAASLALLTLPAISQPTAAPVAPATRPVVGGTTTTLPPVIVTAEKRAEPLQDVPQSVTVLGGEEVRDAGITNITQAARRAPNVTLSEFTNRRLSFPFVRGIGSGRNNPAVTTYHDGVPQLSFATSNIEYLDVERIEFLRGPQGTLYGRNTLGGVINVVSKQPTNLLESNADLTVGNYGLWDFRAGVRGPIVADKAYFSFSGGYLSRDGFSTNQLTGNDLDDRESFFGRAELRFTPTDRLDVRIIANGQRDRDGDYALYDLASLRDTPRRVLHDFEGSSERDVAQLALVATYSAPRVEITSVSALQYWRSHDITDLDASPADFIRRDNRESQTSFIQEIRFASPTDRPIELGKDARLSWIGGVFLFTTDYEQRAGNEFRPAAVPVFGLPAPLTQFTDSDLDNWGAAVFGQVTLTLWEKLDLTAGLRYDHEDAEASINNFNSFPVPGTVTDDDDTFARLSPRFQVAYHWTDDLMTYASAASGFKTGGFNTQSPPAQVGFGPENSWTYEAGVKSAWLNNRLTVNAAAFYIKWNRLQLDTPIPNQPATFFIQNAGEASSRGFEVEVTARPIDGLDLFAGVGYTDAQFDRDSFDQGADVHGNNLPFAPDFTWNVGGQYTLKLAGDLRAFVRAEVMGVGEYFYDASNNASQDSYVLANFRAGLGWRNWRLEAFINNAFNEKYVPLAFPFQLAPSGYVGESGAPQTVGLTLGFTL